jgi:hypothetical protein
MADQNQPEKQWVEIQLITEKQKIEAWPLWLLRMK